MSISVRALPTAYDAPRRSVTVATPSCCCCCCCVDAIVTVTMFTAGVATGAMRAQGRTDRHKAVLAPVVLVIAAIAATFAAAMVGDTLGGSDLTVWVQGIVLLAGFAGPLSWALHTLGSRPVTIAVTNVLVGILFVAVTALELFLIFAVFESLLPWLFAPLFGWGGWRLGLWLSRLLQKPPPDVEPGSAAPHPTQPPRRGPPPPPIDGPLPPPPIP